MHRLFKHLQIITAEQAEGSLRPLQTNKFYNLKKYILNLNKSILQVWTNTIYNLEKYILQ